MQGRVQNGRRRIIGTPMMTGKHLSRVGIATSSMETEDMIVHTRGMKTEDMVAIVTAEMQRKGMVVIVTANMQTEDLINSVTANMQTEDMVLIVTANMQREDMVVIVTDNMQTEDMVVIVAANMQREDMVVIVANGIVVAMMISITMTMTVANVPTTMSGIHSGERQGGQHEIAMRLAAREWDRAKVKHLWLAASVDRDRAAFIVLNRSICGLQPELTETESSLVIMSLRHVSGILSNLL